MVLAGDLARLPFPELVSLIVHGRQSGVLRVYGSLGHAHGGVRAGRGARRLLGSRERAARRDRGAHGHDEARGHGGARGADRRSAARGPDRGGAPPALRARSVEGGAGARHHRVPGDPARDARRVRAHRRALRRHADRAGPLGRGPADGGRPPARRAARAALGRRRRARARARGVQRRVPRHLRDRRGRGRRRGAAPRRRRRCSRTTPPTPRSASLRFSRDGDLPGRPGAAAAGAGRRHRRARPGRAALDLLSKAMLFLLFVAGAHLEPGVHQELHSRVKARVSRD